MKRFFLCLFLFSVFYISAQEEPDSIFAENVYADEGGIETEEGEEQYDEADETGETEEAEPENPDTDYIEMDIKTSSLLELAAWCRELGLSEGGGREELASRLRTYYNLKTPGSAPQTEQKIITIESAKTTEYFTLEVIDEEYARLKGDVIISLKDGNAVHRIKAWEILYNRTRNVMTASGKVEYVKEDGDTIETFKGDSITVNLDNWASIFMDGVSEKSIAGNTTAYRFAGTVISRNSEEVTVLTGADITNPVNEEAFWSLHASKLWLLPGNDWAILNAVLKVGNIPLLYLPFFYYPSDEIVFHPVLGYRTREGTFLQTTTYILGRPKTEAISENSLTKIFGSTSENMERKREGVFLRSTGEKRQNPNDTRLSVLFDAYVNLGAYLGTELALPRMGSLGEMSVSAGVGLTRNIYPLSDANTPFPKYDGVSEWNSGMFFSYDVPFRFRLNATGSFQIPNGSFSWSLPYYSDPYVDRDFMDRSEVLDWLTMLREGATASEDETANDIYISSYEWRLSGSFNPNVSFINPYVSSLSISSISISMIFNNRNSPGYDGPLSPPNPPRSFFFPNRFTIYSISGSVSGTPYTSGSASSQQQPAPDAGPAPGDSLLPDLPISPWEIQAPDEAGDAARASQDMFTLSPPSLGQKFELTSGGSPRFSIDYRLTPTTASELQFRSTEANWAEQEDIDWSEVSTVLSRFRGDGNLGFNVNPSVGGAYSFSLRFTGTGAWQDYMFLNEDSEEFTTGGAPDDTKIKTAKNRAYNETYFTSSWDYSASIRPFFQNAIWSNSSLQYNVRGLLAKTTVDTTGDNPEWDWVFGEWEKDTIDTHQVTANIAANIMDYNQTLSVSAVLPPLDSSASGNMTLRAWISETSLRGQVRFPWDEEKRKIEPVYLTETLRLGTAGSFQQYVVYDPEQEEYTTLTSNLSLSGFTAAYSAVYARQWSFNPLYGSTGAGSQALWIQKTDETLEPRELRLGFVKPFTKDNLWGKRLSFTVNVNSSLSFDLQRYTNSRLAFGLGFTFRIINFLDLNLSASSENNVIYRYFQNLPFYDLPVELYPGQETNFFTDLVNSFRFDNEELRRKSGFKMKALNVSMVHHLGDWNANLSVTMTPYLPAGSRSYQFNNEISFLIQWVPIGEIKTQIDYSKERLTVK